VIVKHRDGDGPCLLGALSRSPNETGWAERASQETGLPVESILHAPTTAITEADVAQAPADKRAKLEEARRKGQPVCGRVMEQQLQSESHNPNFAPAVPFVTGFSGLIGAAATMRWLMGQVHESGLYYQFSFASVRGRLVNISCAADCECHSACSNLTSSMHTTPRRASRSSATSLWPVASTRR
jgi:hypothetical protein